MSNNPKIYMPFGMYLCNIRAEVETEELRLLNKKAEALYEEFDERWAELRNAKAKRPIPSQRQSRSGSQLEAKIENLEAECKSLKQQADSLMDRIGSLNSQNPSQLPGISLAFNDGWYLIRKITSYPEGYILFARCEGKFSECAKVNVAQLPTIDWSNGVFYQIYICEGDFETIRFSENGDLLENSYSSGNTTNSTKYSIDFVRTEMLLDDHLLPKVLAKNTNRRGYRVGDLLAQVPREQGFNLPRHYFECAIFEFVSSEDSGFGSLNNRDKWLLASVKGNRNWNGFAIEGIRDRMIKMLRTELDLHTQGEKNNYPNKAYQKLVESLDDVPSYVGELVGNLSPQHSKILNSYYKGKQSKITKSKEFFSQLDELYNDLRTTDQACIQLYEAARIIVFAFDYFMKAKRGVKKPPSFASFFRDNKAELLRDFAGSRLCLCDDQLAGLLSAGAPQTVLTSPETLDALPSEKESGFIELESTQESRCPTKGKNHNSKRKSTINQSD